MMIKCIRSTLQHTEISFNQGSGNDTEGAKEKIEEIKSKLGLVDSAKVRVRIESVRRAQTWCSFPYY